MKQGNLFDDDAFKPPTPNPKETKYALKKQAIPFDVSVRIPLLFRTIIRFSGTGHRPDKLGGYHKLEQSGGIVVPYLIRYLINCHAAMATDPSDRIVVISGLAQGWDTWLLEAALASGVCYTVAACPCPGQESPWPARAQEKYRGLIEQVDKYVLVCDSYDYDAMQLRNEYMVDESDVVLAMWNGTKGGTHNCIKYADRVNRDIFNFWSELAPLLDLA